MNSDQRFRLLFFENSKDIFRWQNEVMKKKKKKKKSFGNFGSTYKNIKDVPIYNTDKLFSKKNKKP